MNILFITSRADIGGGPKHLLDLTTQIKKDYPSWKLFIACPNEKPHFDNYLKVSDKILIIPKRKFSLLSFIKLLLFCKEEEISVIHSHGRGAGYYSRLLALFNFRVIHTFHGIHKDLSFKGKIKFLSDKSLTPLSDKNICVSREELEEAKELLNLDQEKSLVIYNGVTVPNIESTNSSKKSDKILFGGYLARLNYQKGIDLLITLISQVPEHLRDKFKIQIAGSGELEEDLRLKISTHKLEEVIKLLGETNEPIKFLNECDFYISSARWEGLPISVLEAMALKKPCILSQTKGNLYFIENSTALGYNINDSRSLSHALNTILDPGVRGELSNKAFQFINKHHSLKSMVKATINSYYSVTGEENNTYKEST